MMMTGGFGFFWIMLFLNLLFVGFAYMIWVTAEKEKGAMKTVGRVIAAAIAALALMFFLYGGLYGGLMGRGVYRGMCREPGMWGPKSMRHMMLLPKRERYRYLQKMKRSPQLRQWINEYMEGQEKRSLGEVTGWRSQA